MRFDIIGCSTGMTSIKGWIRIVPDVEQDCPRDCSAGNLCDPSEPNIDQLRLDPKAGCPVAVDGQGQGRAAGLLVGCDVTQLWYCLQLVEDLRRPLVQLVEIGVLQGVLILPVSGARRY